MRVATYTQATAATRGSLFALLILLSVILLGSGVLPTLFIFIGGALPQLVTPLWLVLYVGSLAGLMFTQGINWISWLVRYRILLVLLIAGAVMSVTWSIDTKLSTERAVHLVGSTLVAVYIGFSIPLLATLRIFAVVLALTMFASIAVALGVPALGIEDYEGGQVWRGVYNSKNDLGFWAAVGILLYITLSDSVHSAVAKVSCILMVGICLALLALSQSATSLLALLVAGSLSLYLFIAIRFQLSFIRMAVLAVLFILLTALAIAQIETAELVGRSGDLTGRGEVWRQTWKLIVDKPLTGYGYGALWFPNDASMWIQESLTDFSWVVHHAHNGLLQVASEIGLPLALIAILMVTQQLIEIFYCQYQRQQVGVLFVLAFATAYLVGNYSEARFLVTRELYWIFFLALPISMLRQINLVESPGAASQADEKAPAEPYGSQAPAGAYATAGGGYEYAVPGKPWLGLHPRDRAGSAAESGSGLVPYSGQRDHAENYKDKIYTDESDDSGYDDEYDLDSSLSLTVTEIDLGELVDESVTEAAYFEDSLDVTAEVIDEDFSIENDQEVLDEYRTEEQTSEAFVVDTDSEITEYPTSDASEPDHDDSFGNDRYDINLDITGEWVDEPLDDDLREKR